MRHNANDLARIYVETINGPANGWGQYCHDDYGQSHHIMLALIRLVGDDAAQSMIKAEMAKAKGVES